MKHFESAAIYRLYTREGALLYIGRTVSLLERLHE